MQENVSSPPPPPPLPVPKEEIDLTKQRSKGFQPIEPIK
jgi:hypothetical protein